MRDGLRMCIEQMRALFLFWDSRLEPKGRELYARSRAYRRVEDYLRTYSLRQFFALTGLVALAIFAIVFVAIRYLLGPGPA